MKLTFDIICIDVVAARVTACLKTVETHETDL
jgi:hypothetical protein